MRVIGVGVKQSWSELLIAICDEFIYYDDLVRDSTTQRRENRETAPRRTPEEESNRRDKLEARKTKAVQLAAATFADLIADRGDTERVWASVLKEVIKRRNPGFNETYFGFRSFGNLLEEAANRGLIGFGRDEKSGAYVTRVQARPVALPLEAQSIAEPVVIELVAVNAVNEPKNEMQSDEPKPVAQRRRGARRPRKEAEIKPAEVTPVVESVAVLVTAEAPATEPPAKKRAARSRKPKPVSETENPA